MLKRVECFTWGTQYRDPITQEDYTMNQGIALNTATRKLITDAVSVSVKTTNKWRMMAESLVADGITCAMLEKGTKKSPSEFLPLQQDISACIRQGFLAEVRALLDHDLATLSEERKAERKYWQGQVGSYFGKIQRHVKNILEPKVKGASEGESEGEGETAKTSTKTDLAKFQKHIEDATRIVKEGEDIPNAVRIVKLLAEVHALANGI